MVEREWLRPEECAQVLSLSRSLTYRLIAEGTIPSVRVNRVVRVPVAALHTWAAKMEAVLAEPPPGPAAGNGPVE